MCHVLENFLIFSSFLSYRPTSQPIAPPGRSGRERGTASTARVISLCILFKYRTVLLIEQRYSLTNALREASLKLATLRFFLLSKIIVQILPFLNESPLGRASVRNEETIAVYV